MGIFWNWLRGNWIEYTFSSDLGAIFMWLRVTFMYSRVLASHPSRRLPSKKFLQPTVLTPFLSRPERLHHLKKTH